MRSLAAGAALVAVVLVSSAVGAVPSGPRAGEAARTYRFTLAVEGKPTSAHGFERLPKVRGLTRSKGDGSGTVVVDVPQRGPHRPRSAAGTLRLRHVFERGPAAGLALQITGVHGVWPGGRREYRSTEAVRLAARVTVSGLPGCAVGERAIVSLNRRPRLFFDLSVCGTTARYDGGKAGGPAVSIVFTPPLS